MSTTNGRERARASLLTRVPVRGSLGAPAKFICSMSKLHLPKFIGPFAMSVVMHSKPGCVYCDKASALLREMGVPFLKKVYQPNAPGYAQVRDALFASNNHNSFPHIYVGDVFVGGFSELQEARASTDLDKWLAAIGIYIEEF